MYARSIGDRELTFDFGAGLIEDNLLIVDRETDSVWSQLEGRAVSGELKDSPLPMVPSIQTTWSLWRKLHPDTHVWVGEDEEGRPYVYRTWILGEPRPEKRPTQHAVDHLGLGLAMNGEAIFFPLTQLAETEAPIKLTVGGVDVEIHHRVDELTAWATRASDGELLAGVMAYEWGWRRFQPKSRTWHYEGEMGR